MSFRGQEIEVEDAEVADPSGLDIALFSAGATMSRGAGATVRRRRRVVVDNSSAWRNPDVPLVVSEVNFDRDVAGRARTPSAGHHREPELHHDGRHAGAQTAARRGRADPDDRVELPGGLRAGLAGVEELASQARAVIDGVEQLVHDGSALEYPAPVKYVAPIAFNVVPLAGSLVDDGRGRPTRTRSCATRAARSWASPNSRSPAPACGCRCSPALAVDQRRVRPVAVGGPRAGTARGRAGVKLVDVPTPLAAAGVDESLVGRIRQDPGVPDGAGLALFISGDNLRRARRSAHSDRRTAGGRALTSGAPETDVWAGTFEWFSPLRRSRC